MGAGPQGPQNPPPGTTPGPQPSQNQATGTAPSTTAGDEIDLGNGVRIIQQVSNSGRKTHFTGSGMRTIIAVRDGKGRTNYFYQSFSGTGGKTQGRWYASGGVVESKKGDRWIIKGDPDNDKGYGRKDLADLEDYVNTVLPQNDKDLDTYLAKHGYTYQDLHFKDEFKKRANYTVDDFGETPLRPLGNRGDILDQWKRDHLNKVWGQRQGANPHAGTAQPQATIPSARPDLPPGTDHLPRVHETTEVPERKTSGQWRRTPGNKPSFTPFSPFDDAESDMFREQFAKFPPTGTNWYVASQSGKTQYGTGPNARKMRATDPKSADWRKRNRPTAPGWGNTPDEPPPDMPPSSGPLALMPPNVVRPPVETESPPVTTEIPPEIAAPRTSVEADELVRQLQQAEKEEFFGTFRDDNRYQFSQLAQAQAGRPFRSTPESTADLVRAHEMNLMGVAPTTFESDTLTSKGGRQVKPKEIRLLAAGLNDANLYQAGLGPKNVENPYKYTTEDAGPDALGLGYDGDVQIAGYERIGSGLIGEWENTQDPRVKQGLGNLIRENFAVPRESMIRQRGLLAQAEQAKAEGNMPLYEQLRADATELAMNTYAQSPRVRDAFAQMRGEPQGYIENTTAFSTDPGVTYPGVFTPAPNSAMAGANRLNVRELAAAEERLARYTPEQIRAVVQKAAWARNNMNFADLSDEEATIARDYQTATDQKAIDAVKQSWMQTTGQTGKLKDAKGFGGINIASPVPLDEKSWSSPKELIRQTPPINADDAADAEFDRFLTTYDDTAYKRGEAEVPVQQWMQNRSTASTLEEEVADAIAVRMGMLARNQASKAFYGLDINAAEAASILQAQEKRGEDAGYGPQRTNHFRPKHIVDEMLWNVEHSTGNIPGMDEIGRRAYHQTYQDVMPQVQEALSGLTEAERNDPQIINFIIQDAVSENIRSASQRILDPENDTSGQFNPLRMPNTRGLNQDDPNRKTLQDLVNAEAYELANPTEGSPYQALMRTLDTNPQSIARQNLADQNVAGAFGIVDDQEVARKKTFWQNELEQAMKYPEAPGSSAIAQLAERQLAVLEATSFRNPPPPPEVVAPQPEQPSMGAPTSAKNAKRIAGKMGVRIGDANAVEVRSGLRRVGNRPDLKAAETPTQDVVDEVLPVAEPVQEIAQTPAIALPRPEFSTESEKAIQKQNAIEPKQWRRQQRDLFSSQQAKGRKPNPNDQLIHADQFMLGDEVEIEVPGKIGSRRNTFTGAEVVDISPEGIVTLEDGPEYGTIRMDPDDPETSTIRVRNMIRPDPDYAAELASAQLAAFEEEPPATKGAFNTTKSVKRSTPTGLVPEALENLQGTVFQQVIQGEVPKILSRSEADRQAKASGLNVAAGYDSADFPSNWSNKIFAKDGSSPDEVHAHLVDKGLMREDSTVDDMMNAIYKGIGDYENQVTQIKEQKVVAQQQDRAEKELFVQKKPGGKPINPNVIAGRDLVMGQKLRIAVPNAKGRKDKTELAEVVDIDEDGNAILEDGERYGKNILVPADRNIYYKELIERNPDDFQQPDPWDSPDTGPVVRTPTELDELDQIAMEEAIKRRRRMTPGNPYGDVPF